MHKSRAQSYRRTLLACIALPLSPLTIAVASAQVVSGKPAPQVLSIGAAAGQIKFESSLASGTIAQPFISAPLSWSAYPGAASYRVLRGQSASTAPVAITSVTGTGYAARVLPGNSFVFRVVAVSATGKAIDTTKAVSVTTAAGPGQASLTASCTKNNGTLTLGWNAFANADDYSVTIELQGKRPPHGNMPPPDTLVAANVTTTSYSTTMAAPPPTGYVILIRANYTLHDYPTAGKTTRVDAAAAGFSEVNPFGTPGSCMAPPPA